MTRAFPASVDVAIVGSGPAGSAYARILSERSPDATIAMFELGPTVSDPPGSHVKNIEDAELRGRAQTRSEGPSPAAGTFTTPGAVRAGERRGRAGTYLLEAGYQAEGEDGLPAVAFSTNVGGMSAHWTAACPRPGGSERIGYLPDLDELLGEAERLLGVTTDAFDGARLSAVVRERLAAAVDPGRPDWARVQRMPLAVHRRDDGRLVWSGADVVLGDETRSNGNFQLHDEALVRRVLVEDGRAVGVEVEDRRSGETHTVRARFVVVAADAVRTPQVLWASGIRPDALGRTLNDQSQVVFATRLRNIDPADVPPPSVSGTLSEYSGVSWVPFTDDVPFHGQVMQLDASPVPLPTDDQVVPGSIVGLGLFCAKDLQWDDRVEFDDAATDSFGMPALSIRYRLTDADRAMIARAAALVQEWAAVLGDPIGDRPFTMPLGSSLHYQGTTRMGETDDGRSVCDPHGEVWTVPGLFVAGNGVIPTATACNPTLTGVALAVRGARHIAEQLALA